MREWLSLSELAAEALPGMPGTRQAYAARALQDGWDKTSLVRDRAGRGAGKEYHYSLLPEAAQVELLKRYGRKKRRANDNAAIVKADWRTDASQNAWAYYNACADKYKDEAKRRLKALVRYDELYAQHGAATALKVVSLEYDISGQTIRNWLDIRRRTNRGDLLPALLPNKRGGGGQRVEIEAEVWDFLCSDYLSLSQPAFKSSYRRLQRFCRHNNFDIPNERTLWRRIEELPPQVVVLAREGEEALKRLYPAQRRIRSMFHAMEALNADGHRWDVMVEWEDGSVSRPYTVAFQDLYSGKFVGWRHAQSENKEAVRLALGDTIMSYGLPDICYFDNGRTFASKWMTGRMPNRYRFKIKDEEPAGILTQLEVEVHWTTPYHGQSKPIERGWRDFANDIARGPWFVGAYTGNSPVTKPANYGARAIPIKEFVAIVDREIMEHNARPGRTSAVCGGKLSFNQAFDESYAKALIRQPSAEQKMLFLLAAEGVKAQSKNGEINFCGNRYWHERLLAESGQNLVLRFDPDNLHTSLPVYRRDGTLICLARLLEDAGFANTTAAREHAKNRNAYARATRDQLAAEKKLTAKQIAEMLPMAPGLVPEPKPIAARAPVYDNLARDIANEDDAQAEFLEGLGKHLRLIRNQPKGPLDV